MGYTSQAQHKPTARAKKTLKRAVFLDKDMRMENAQKYDICTNVPSSQTIRSYLNFIILIFAN
jgi:hypothetical protein